MDSKKINGPILLKAELKNIDGRIIVPKGAEFTKELCDTLIKDSGKYKLEHIWQEPFKSDWDKVLNESNYETVFELSEDRELILKILRQIKVSSPILEELNYMKTLDFYTYRHIFMATTLTIIVAKTLVRDEDGISKLAHAALTHDFGKMRIPLEILKSSEKLTKTEYEYIYQHPVMGHLLLLHYYGNRSFMADISLKHHEYPDGSGYPLGLTQKDEDIGIITANDIFDALISPRAYRKKPFDIRGAIDFIWDKVVDGILFERPARCLISINRKEKPDIKSITVHAKKRGFMPLQTNYGPSNDDEE